MYINTYILDAQPSIFIPEPWRQVVARDDFGNVAPCDATGVDVLVTDSDARPVSPPFSKHL